MNGEKLHQRFWVRMAENYGRRWFDDYGEKPSVPWVEALNKYTPHDIAGAFELLKTCNEFQQFPPTLPAFEDLMARAARARRAGDAQQDWRRGAWRSSIVAGVARGLGLTIAEFEPLLVKHRDTLGRAMRDLMDELCELENKTGQRTSGMENHCRERVSAIVGHWHWVAERQAA